MTTYSDTREILEYALSGDQQTRADLVERITEIRRQLDADGTLNRPRGTLSAAGRKRISDANRKRWEVYRKAKRNREDPGYGMPSRVVWRRSACKGRGCLTGLAIF